MAPRGLSTRLTAISSGVAAGRQRAGASGRDRSSSSRARVWRSSSSRWSTRARTSPMAREPSAGLEPVVGQPALLRGARVLGDAACPRGGADGPERDGIGRAEHADSRQAILEGGVEEQRPPGARSIGSDARERLAGGGALTLVELQPALADVHAVEQQAMARELGVEATRILAEGGEALVPGRHPHAGADRGDVVQVAPEALELEQDRARSRGLGIGSEARAAARRRGRRRRGWSPSRPRTHGPHRRCPRRGRHPRRRARARGACRRAARRGGGCGRRRRGSGSGPTR